MFKKINAFFRPNRGPNAREDYHSACTVRLVRSASMLAVGERSSRAQRDSTLKRSASAVSVHSSTALYYYHSREERVWLYSQNQECLEYLQELVALRRRYTKSVSDLKQGERREQTSSKKKTAPQPPQHWSLQLNGFNPNLKASRAIINDTVAQYIDGKFKNNRLLDLHVRPQPSAPPIPSEEDTLQFFDAVIASCDSEHTRKPHVDDGHADVDFIVATSTSQHDLHSNWVLRDPRRISTDVSQLKRTELGSDEGAWRKSASGTTSSMRRLQRNPIHLPKVVESALQTLRFKPKLKKKE